jgi:uncharacterized protein YggU (UPF0235/DUF167 family)
MVLNIKARVGAQKTTFRGIVNIDGVEHIKLDVNALPIDGNANRTIIKYIAKYAHVPQSNIEIILGISNSVKILRIFIDIEAYYKFILNTRDLIL